MRYDDTVAAKARYGDIVGRVFGDYAVVLAESSEAGYSGSCKVLFRFPSAWDCKEQFVFYEWDYGSCSGCDGWEREGLHDFEIMDEVLRTCARFKTREAVMAWAEKLPSKPTWDEDGVSFGDKVRAALAGLPPVEED